jgi:hypothetical protein
MQAPHPSLRAAEGWHDRYSSNDSADGEAAADTAVEAWAPLLAVVGLHKQLHIKSIYLKLTPEKRLAERSVK